MTKQKKALERVKTCPRCGRKKPASKFYSNKNKYDGLSSYCIKCSRAIAKERYHAPGSKDKARVKEYYNANRAHIDESKKEWNKRNKEKLKQIKRRWYEKNRLRILEKMKRDRQK